MCRARTPFVRVTSGFADQSGCSSVLVDDAAEESGSPYRAVGRDDAWVVTGWVLVEALMWTVLVEMPLVGTKDRAGMTLVVDQHLVGALADSNAGQRLAYRSNNSPRLPGDV